jgi:hypothetical protein
MKLHLKFEEDAGDNRRCEVAKDAERLGATVVRPLFPHGKNAARRSLYIVELGEDADPERVSTKLRRHAGVESIEPEFKRFLVS